MNEKVDIVASNMRSQEIKKHVEYPLSIFYKNNHPFLVFNPSFTDFYSIFFLFTSCPRLSNLHSTNNFLIRNKYISLF